MEPMTWGMRLSDPASTKPRSKAETSGMTQPGQIAVVYSRPNEYQEMTHHINFLQGRGYLNGDLEPLELDDLPGVQGLRALRVGVNLDSVALAERALGTCTYSPSIEIGNEPIDDGQYVSPPPVVQESVRR